MGSSLRKRWLAGTPIAALVVIVNPVSAQVPNVRVAGRAQVQYRWSSGDSTGNYNGGAVNNGFEIRRLRIQTDVRFGENMNLVVQPSFEMGSLRMRDAYVRVGLTPRFGLTLGQEKTPFQRYELTSSNTLPSVERGLRILGLSGREALNDLLTNNGYVSHDLGAFADFAAPANRVTLKLGFQNGSRESALDVNNAKSLFGRATAIVMTNRDDQPVLQLGGSFALRDRAICSTCTGALAYFPDSSKSTTAFALDLEWGGFRPGFHLILDVATGDNVPAAFRVTSGRNTGNLTSSSDTNIVTFRAIHAVAAYRVETSTAENAVVRSIEPALRLDVTDPNSQAANDAGMLITPALNIYFGSTVVARAAFDVYRYKDATATSRMAREFKLSWQANF